MWHGIIHRKHGINNNSKDALPFKRKENIKQHNNQSAQHVMAIKTNLYYPIDHSYKDMKIRQKS